MEKNISLLQAMITLVCQIIMSFKKPCPSLAKNGLGSGSSPLISGYSESHKELECLISEFLGTQSTIIFSSGYQTNVGVIKSISEPTDHILIDKLDHASIVDGTLFSKAKFKDIVITIFPILMKK